MSDSPNESERRLLVAPGSPTGEVDPHGPGISFPQLQHCMQDSVPGGEHLSDVVVLLLTVTTGRRDGVEC